MFAGEHQHSVAAPFGKGSVASCVELRLLEDFCAQLRGDNVQKHAPGHVVSVLKLLAVHVEQLIPAIDVLAHILEALATAVFTEALGSGVIYDLAFTLELAMQPTPDCKAIAFLRFTAGELCTTQVESLGQPIDNHLL